jgi:hypothetical protein
VWDAETHPQDFARFQPGGEQSDPKDLEAIAYTLYIALCSIHKNGLLGVALKHPFAR